MICDGNMTVRRGCEDMLEEILPERILSIIDRFEDRDIFEIRMRTNSKLKVNIRAEEKRLDYVVNPEDIAYALNNLTNSSLYAYNEQMVRGYISYGAGYRIGICGEAVCEKGQILTIKNINSLIFRIPHDVKGVCDGFYGHIFSKKGINNVLVVGLPGSGKTTVLRELARKLSIDGFNVLILDEKNEISASVDGRNNLDIGDSDVLVGNPRKEGFENLIRNTAPDVIITDELYSEKDLYEAEWAMKSGVSVITSVHGSYITGNYCELFDKIIYLKSKKSPGCVDRIESRCDS